MAQVRLKHTEHCEWSKLTEWCGIGSTGLDVILNFTSVLAYDARRVTKSRVHESVSLLCTLLLCTVMYRCTSISMDATNNLDNLLD